MSGGASSPSTRLYVAADADVSRLIVESVRLALPDCDPQLLEPSALANREMPATDCTIVGPSFATRDGIDAVRALRAAGLAGPIVKVLRTGTLPDAEHMALGVMDVVGIDDGPTRLAEAIAASMLLDEESPAVRSLRRAQRLMAMGEVASGLQHAVNNPLTALLGEAQLLELEPLAEEHRRAVERMVELCRRIAALVRKLDVVGRIPPTPAARALGDEQRA
jgi:signal transduction histidine kinase